MAGACAGAGAAAGASEERAVTAAERRAKKVNITNIQPAANLLRRGMPGGRSVARRAFAKASEAIPWDTRLTLSAGGASARARLPAPR